MRITGISTTKIEFDLLYSSIDSYIKELESDKDLMTKPNLYNFYNWLHSYKTIVEQGGTMVKVNS